jgi:hypothetical protein
MAGFPCLRQRQNQSSIGISASARFFQGWGVGFGGTGRGRLPAYSPGPENSHAGPMGTWERKPKTAARKGCAVALVCSQFFPPPRVGSVEYYVPKVSVPTSYLIAALKFLGSINRINVWGIKC